MLDRAIRAVELPAGGDALARAVPTEANGVDLELRRAWAAVDGVRAAGATAAAALAGTIRPDAPQKAKLEAKRRVDAVARRVPLTAEGSGRFTARVSLEELGKAGPTPDDETRPDRDEGVLWELAAALGGGRRLPVLVPDRLAGGIARRTAPSSRSRARGRATRRSWSARRARWSDRRAWDADGALALAGTLPLAGEAAFVLRLARRRRGACVPVRGEGGRFSATLTPAAIASMAGTLPLREGTWRLFLRAGGQAEAPVMVAPALVAAGPLEHTVAHKGFTFSPTGQDGAAILVERDLDDDERGPFHQRRLRAVIAAAGARPLRDAVVYASLRRAPVLGQPARDPRGARAARRCRSSTCGWCATAPARSRRAPACCARAAASTTRRSPPRATSSPTTYAELVPARATARWSSRRCTATRSAARASTSPRSAARRGGC